MFFSFFFFFFLKTDGQTRTYTKKKKRKVTYLSPNIPATMESWLGLVYRSKMYSGESHVTSKQELLSLYFYGA